MKILTDQSYKEMWDERYGEEGHAYGKEPNEFFRQWLDKFTAGAILMPADGEGRNGVFAARSGWDVTAYDLSVEGKRKAFKLANDCGITMDYLVGDLKELKLKEGYFDAIGLIYAHFLANRKSETHQMLDRLLKPGGIIIFEAFSKRHLLLNQLDPKVGGPTEVDMLFSKEEIGADFKGYEVIMLEEEEIDLNEGKYHVGKGAVIRFVGRKVL